MIHSTDVVIVGAGVAGCAVAYYLAKSGVRSVIIERRGVASGASGYSAGGLNPLEGAGIPGPLGPMAAESFRMHTQIWPELTELSGIDFGAKIISSVRVAFSESDIEDMENTRLLFESAGADFGAEWLNEKDLRRLEPRISHDAICGLDTRGNAALDSERYTAALAGSAVRLGAQIVQAEVTGINSDGDEVTEVLTDAGNILCSSVVFATGPWSGIVQQWLNIPLPIEPYKGEILRMKLPNGSLSRDFQGAGISLNHRKTNQIWIGATEERAGFDDNTSERARQTLMNGAFRLMPAMKDAELLLHTACLRPLSPDWMPIVGQAPDWKNAWLATGAGKKGILISPGMGKAIADLITRGSTTVPISGFGVERFDK